MIVSTQHGGEEIRVNLSATVEAYYNPKAYQHLLNKSHAPAGSRIERIVVHDQIGGITLPEGPVWEAALVEQLEKQHTFLEKMREGIEDIFDEEHNVAAIFTLSG